MSNSKQFSFIGKAFYPLMMIFAVIILALSIGVYHHVQDDTTTASIETTETTTAQAVD
ncbi:hypothetical protein [Persicobacter psychrovividus]|uniref:Uncharacterized protein n=1 Tax=Persicobacter psychrovividus TaxID=387638 RepID=A0ABM7VAT5_9BACT|nr:hypothetical protein PEPS_00680 [Persicobacter psychrovividus]